ncbi:hypothetical protein PGQ11_014572 [Apiospora arundinis]|uniref:Rhodopsin domain-containing protein n=1 Tax=Apiospora arundinis TaxID=335852 RepID=A0ABR2HSM6_9PEZI
MAVRDAYFPVIITFIFIDSIAVGLRFAVRRSKGAIGYDDFAMLLSFVGFVLFGAMELTAIRYGIGATEMEPTFDPMNAAKYFTIAAVVYLLASGVSKIGVGLVLYRLADSTDMYKMRWFLMGCMTLTAVWFIGGALVFAMQCRPLAKAWDLTGSTPGICMSVSVIGTAGIVISAGDVFFTTVFALSPVYMLRKVQMHFKLKLSILGLLGLGLVSAAMTIIRLKYVITVTKMTSETGIAGPSVINTTLEATIYSILEISTSILAAAMSALRPLLARLPCFRSLGSSGEIYPKRADSSHDLSASLGSRGPSYRLDDMAAGHSRSGSQERIVHPVGGNIRKCTEVQVVYERQKKTTPQRTDW